MTPERWSRVDGILDDILEAAPQQRPERLAELCQDDPELQREVEELLAAASLRGPLDATAGEILDSLFDESEENGQEEVLGALMGPYRLVKELGRGGMGVVYLADRVDGQFEQRVALKLVKRGLDTDEILERFRRERQILARLQHNAIARLFDGGATGDGRPYFAMEYVVGQPITVYCDARHLSIEERLQLFRRVCEAVHHAHRNLVVHRDLKPANIMVTEEGDLKLLDFGVAKLLGDEEASTGASSALTRMGLRAMTPEYAAPEQVRGEAITTATDVYALGVVLYELLTGRRPYELPRGSGPELQRAIDAMEIPRPSTKVEVDSGGEGRPAGERARMHGLTPLALRRQLAGDLDAITLTALRKEPQRRYGSAQALGEDIDRYLAGQPVTARPEGGAYRVGKFIRRRRGLVAAAASVLAVLVAGVVVSSALYMREQTARRQAEDQLRLAKAGRLLALARLRIAGDRSAAVAYALASLELADDSDARRFVLEALHRGPIASFLMNAGQRVPISDEALMPTNAEFSPDGRWLAEGLWSGDIRMWSSDGAAAMVLKPKQGDGPAQYGLFNPDSTLLAFRHVNGIRYWSVPSGNPASPFETHIPAHVRWFLDRRLVVLQMSKEGADTWRFRWELWTHGGGKRTLVEMLPIPAKSAPWPDIDAGLRAVVFSRGKDLYRINVGSNNRARLIGSHPEPITEVAFPRRGDLFASSDTSGEVRLWSLLSSVAGPARIVQWPIGSRPAQRLGDLDSLGSRAAMYSSDGLIYVRDFAGPPDAEPNVLQVGPQGQLNQRCSFHPSGAWLATSTRRGTMIWPLHGRYPRVLRGHTGAVYGLQFTPDGKQLASTSRDGTLRVWPLEPAAGSVHRIVLRTSHPLLRLAIDPTGDRLLTTTEVRGEAWLVGLREHTTQALRGVADWSSENGSSFDPRGRFAAAGGLGAVPWDAVIRVWDLESGAVTYLDPKDGLPIRDLAFTQDGGLLSAGDGGLRLWDLGARTTQPPLAPAKPPLKGDSSTGRLNAHYVTLRSHATDSIDLGHDGKYLLGSGATGVFLLDLRNGHSSPLGSLASTGRVHDVVLDPSGTIAIAAGDDGTVRVCAITGGAAHLLIGHEGAVFAVAVSPDGKWIASGGEDGTVRLWPMPKGTPFHLLPYETLLTRIRSLTNLRAVPDDGVPGGYRLEVSRFRGWQAATAW